MDVFKRGALLAADPHNYDAVPNITDEERTKLGMEHTHKWHQPWTIYYIAFISSMAAVVQGMDEAVSFLLDINFAQSNNRIY